MKDRSFEYQPFAGAAPKAERDRYPPISDYGVIGDCRTLALISKTGSMDWLCLPHFGAPSVFAALLDADKGGRFIIQPTTPFRVTRKYRDMTCIIETTFHTETGSAKIIDLMPALPDVEGMRFLQPEREVLRMIEVVEGEVEMQAIFQPRPEFGRADFRLRKRGNFGWCCEWRNEILILHSDFEMTHDQALNAVCGKIKLKPGERRYLSLSYEKGDVAVVAPLYKSCDRRLRVTEDWWRDWANECSYDGPHGEMVKRSAVVMKILTYTLSGSMIAAGTASLPESIGGTRNWDYRFCWMRDASLALRAFLNLGYRGEAEAYNEWLLHATRLTRPRLQVLYDVYGRTDVAERELEHFEGWRGSKPVRIGNGAHCQSQLDMYGELVLAVDDYVQRGGTLIPSEKKMLVGFGKLICEDWKLADRGIWEVRGKDRQLTFSKVLCWVTLDRLLRLYKEGELEIPEGEFRKVRNDITEVIETEGYNSQIGAYTAELGGTELDASLLLLPRVGYKRADDPRMVSTFERVCSELGNGDVLIRRYRTGYDGFDEPEGAFGACCFWAVDVLARRGMVEEAESRFDKLMSYANDLGLFSEEFDMQTGEALGNFPQAFTHVALVDAAFTLAEARRGEERKRD